MKWKNTKKLDSVKNPKKIEKPKSYGLLDVNMGLRI